MDLSLDHVKASPQKVVGTKQTLKSIHKGEVKAVAIAQDADKKIVDAVIELCEEKGIAWSFVGTMAELGRTCGIKVGAATVALLE